MSKTIVIIGAGPRGTYALRRVSRQLAATPVKGPVDIHVIEKSGNFGGGGVHGPDQPEYLLLNTVASQITAVGDDDEQARRLPDLATLHGYLASRGLPIGPNDYPSRAHHGRYLAHVFDWTENHLPPRVRLHRHAVAAVDIDTSSGVVVVLEGGRTLKANEVLLVTGHGANRYGDDSPESRWADFAEQQRRQGRNLSYIHQVYPIHETTTHIQKGQTVYVIGMGLTGIDIVRTFSLGRGGRFDKECYFPSGNEPHTILGSRLGLPYAARAHNQKTGQYKGQIFRADVVERLRATKGRLSFEQDLFPLMVQEMELVYYGTLHGEDFSRRYLAAASDAQRQALIDQAIGSHQRFDWSQLADPLASRRACLSPGQPLFASLEDYQAFVIATMEADIAEAQMGNATSPLKAAIDCVLRDCRDTLRAAVNFGGLTPASHRYFKTVFDRINNRIAVGPPVASSNQLLCLSRSGLVGFSGPQPQITMDPQSGCFWVESPQVAGSRRRVHHIINGRIHGVDVQREQSALMQNLLAKGLVRTWVNTDGNDRYPLGGLDVTADFHVIDRQANAHPHICAIGIPTEGKIWFNAVDARPDVNSTAIAQLSQWAAQAVARLG